MARQTRMWELARAVVKCRECPRCHAKVNEPCRNLATVNSVRDRGRKTISVPHKERYPAGNTAIGSTKNAALLELNFEFCSCGHYAYQHGLKRCLALLDNDEPCTCGRGYKS